LIRESLDSRYRSFVTEAANHKLQKLYDVTSLRKGHLEVG